MLMKIGDVTGKFGISHRSLHYWESVGILKSSRAGNDYRYYDEENLLKIKQIVLLRKLRMPIPSIQEIFTSNELAKVIAVFTAHWDETKKETEQLNALGVVLRQLLNMLKDKQDVESVYIYLDTPHSAEAEELKAALKTVLSEPAKEISVETLPERIVDITGVDLSLELMTAEQVDEVTDIIKRCYSSTNEMDMLRYCQDGWDFRGLNMSDCRWFYRIMQGGECVGAVHLAYVGMEAMLIRCLAYSDPDNNVYIFELLKRKHPDILCWMIRNAPDGSVPWGVKGDYKSREDFNYDWEGKKQRFWEDNGFTFYTNARYNQFIKMMKPHDEVYKSSRYRFALLDGSMDGVSFRFFGAQRLDFYDGAMTNWRITDCNFEKALIYDSGMGNSKIYDTRITDSEFHYVDFSGSVFSSSRFRNCKLENCDITGMTIDGVNVEEAIKAFQGRFQSAEFRKTNNPGPYKEKETE